MDFNLYPSDLVMAGSYPTSERDLGGPSLQSFALSDDWQMRELLERSGQNSTSSPSPWNMHGSHMSSGTFDSVSVAKQQYVPSESLYSSAGSNYNGLNDWDSYRDPSTPGDGAPFSPGNDTGSLYQGEGYMSQLPLPYNGLEAPTHFQQNPAGNFYGHEAYSLPSEHEPSSNLPFRHESFPSFPQGPGVVDAMTDSDVGSPGSGVLPVTSYPVHEPLSPSEEKELAVNRRSSPIASRTTRPGNKAAKVAPKSAKGQSKVSKPSGKSLHSRSGSKSSKSSTCIQCKTPYKDSAALEKHVKQAHTRPFICIFHYAGCKSTFATKNEWKRHVWSQHLYLSYYHCDYEECATAKPTSARRRPKSLPQYGGIFNRKDLYTQHVRRMHQPDDKKKKPSRQAEEHMQRLHEHAYNQRCALPRHMYCPARNCNEEFIGDKAWDERMEHVARHLERAAAGEEEPLAFGGHHDPTLSAWVESPEVDVVRRCYGGGWKLNNPIKGDDPIPEGSDGSTFDEDAEGEEC